MPIQEAHATVDLPGGAALSVVVPRSDVVRLTTLGSGRSASMLLFVAAGPYERLNAVPSTADVPELTVPVWRCDGTEDEPPWLLRMCDRLRFQPVSADGLDTESAAFAARRRATFGDERARWALEAKGAQ